jgi:type II secretory pathway predicted ATPase ExeA
MYESFFGLSASPFQLNPDPRFLYWSKGHESAHAFLEESAFRGESVIVITGEVGAGKTTLVAARMAELDPQVVVVAQLVSTQLDVKNLLHAIAIAFGLPLPSAAKAQILKAIETFLLELLPLGKHALLVVDEAQNLPPEALDAIFLLSTYPPGRRPLLQFLLLGQPELRERILENPARLSGEKAIASFHLGPMEEAETRAYIEHRLAHVGWKHDPVFAIEAFAGIFSAANGIPRRVNAICNRLLLGAYLAQNHWIGPGDVEDTVAELRNELGPEALPSADPAGEFVAAPAFHAAGSNGMRNSMVSSISARLDRLERNVARMLAGVRALEVREPVKPDARRQTATQPANPDVNGRR